MKVKIRIGREAAPKEARAEAIATRRRIQLGKPGRYHSPVLMLNYGGRRRLYLTWR